MPQDIEIFAFKLFKIILIDHHIAGVHKAYNNGKRSSFADACQAVRRQQEPI
jgi:hypothetical protein